MDATECCPTYNLYIHTKHALELGQWSRARAALDDLGLRDDNTGLLRSAREYGFRGPYVKIIQDRIDRVNSNARKCLAERE